MIQFNNDPTDGWAWDPQRGVFMQQSLFGNNQWEQVDIPYNKRNDPLYQYDPKRHPIYQDAVKTTEARIKSEQMAKDKEKATDSAISYMSWSQNREAQAEINKYNSSYNLSPNSPGYLYMDRDAIKEQEAIPTAMPQGNTPQAVPQNEKKINYNNREPWLDSIDQRRQNMENITPMNAAQLYQTQRKEYAKREQYNARKKAIDYVTVYMSWQQSKAAQEVLEKYNATYRLTPNSPGYLYINGNQLMEIENLAKPSQLGPTLDRDEDTQLQRDTDIFNTASFFDSNTYIAPFQEKKIDDLTPQKGYKIIDSEGNFLFNLGGTDIDPDKPMTTQEIYNKGIQWFAPTAKNYMPIHSINPDIQTISTINHVNPDKLYQFINTPRSFFEYQNDGVGDWKKSKEGGDNYRLSEVNGNLFWSDAIGQLPYTIDTYRTIKRHTGIPQIAKGVTQFIGKEMGAGDLLKGANIFYWDRAKNYDNYMIEEAIRAEQNRKEGEEFRFPGFEPK